MLFMKGTPQEPKCGEKNISPVFICTIFNVIIIKHKYWNLLCTGFSRQMVAILKEYSVDYSTFNILGDEEVSGRC